MSTARPKDKRLPKDRSYEEDSMLRSIDKLAEYEEFVKEIPKDLRAALIEGKDAAALYKKYANFAAVRVLAIIAQEKDSGKALAAAKEVLDRTYGKSVERKQIKHELESLSDNELDSLLLSEIDGNE